MRSKQNCRRVRMVVPLAGKLQHSFTAFERFSVSRVNSIGFLQDGGVVSGVAETGFIKSWHGESLCSTDAIRTTAAALWRH